MPVALERLIFVLREDLAPTTKAPTKVVQPPWACRLVQPATAPKAVAMGEGLNAASYGRYCWANVWTVSTWTRIQTPVERGSNSFSELLPATTSANWAAVIVVPGDGP
jgi:hypothetical protein